MNMTPMPNRLACSLLLWIFVASGFAGLIYQSSWSKYLSLILGHSAYSQALVLVLFMGGMAIGAWITGRHSARIARPLMVYAAIELFIGVLGIGFHQFFSFFNHFSHETLFPLLSVGLPLETAKWGIASALILPQCILLGATFPLMSAGYIRWRPARSGQVLAGLYFSNSLGAAIGALTATYVLVPATGLPGTTMTAGLINIIVALIIWPLAKRPQPLPVLAPTASEPDTAMAEPSATIKPPVAVAPALLLWAAAITGASSFIYEVVWVRMLSMVLGSSFHAFELMLSAFIAGIAFGGLWLKSRADHLRSPLLAVSWVQIAMGFMALSTLFLYNASFGWMSRLLSTLALTDGGYTAFNLGSAAVAIIIMFPTAFFAGMTLPLFTLILLRQREGEKVIGQVYAANTFGSIVGVLVVIGLLLPVIGLRLSLWLAAAIDVGLGLLLLAYARRQITLPKPVLPLATITCALVLALSVGFSYFDPLQMASGVFRQGHQLSPDAASSLFHKDGRTASVDLIETHSPSIRSIMTNGKPDASIAMKAEGSVSGDEYTMASLGVLPMLHHPAAREVGIIGFGSGMTTHFVLGNPEVLTVDTVEIEPAMVEAARFFGDKVSRAFDDPRSHIIIDDAKSYFSTNRRKYDILISEPSNPWVNGVASLFSEEFYRFVPQHLNEGGIFVQWLQSYEITPELIASIGKAFLPYFADIRVFSGGPNDLVVLARVHDPLPPLAALDFPWTEDSAIQQELRSFGLNQLENLKLLYFGDRQLLVSFVGLNPGVQGNSDFFPVLQLKAPKARFQRRSTDIFQQLKMLSPWPILETLTGITPPSLTDFLAEKTQDLQFYQLMFYKALSLQQRLGEEQRQPGRFVYSLMSLRDKILADHLRVARSQCRFDAETEEWLEIFADLAGKTIPFLNAADAAALWNTACVPSDPVLAQMQAFVAASAARNSVRMLELGHSLLEDATFQEAADAFGYVLGGTMLAARALGQPEEARRFEEKYGARAPNQASLRAFLSFQAEQ